MEIDDDMTKSLPIIESCDGCGACCLQQESPPGYLPYITGIYPQDDTDDCRRVNELSTELKQQLAAYVMRLRLGKGHPNNNVCLWFDERTRQCKHYELRPDICRVGLELGDDACRRWRKRYGVGEKTRNDKRHSRKHRTAD